MKKNLTLKDFLKIIKDINQILQDKAKYLSELDSTIGDGDHGITIARGFKNAIKKIEEVSPKSISDLLKTTGITLLSTMGGVSGPIFGSIFTEMAKEAKDMESVGLSDLYNMFSAALDKVSKLGGAKPGDKTLIDSFYPAVESLKDSLSINLSVKGALKRASLAAIAGVESTKDMVATKGRSKYLGERSLGYQDAGATTLYLIIKAMYEAV